MPEEDQSVDEETSEEPIEDIDKGEPEETEKSQEAEENQEAEPAETSRLERETVEDLKKIKIDELEDILETDPDKKSRGIMLIQFVLPWGIALLEILLLFLFLSRKTFVSLGFWMTIYFFPPFGKETVIPLGISGDKVSAALPWVNPDTIVALDPLLIALSIASLDIIAGLFLVWNFDLAKRIPILGKYIKKFENKGGDMLSKNKYIEALSFIGVTLFVIVPFQGSGAVGASIMGRMIGMNPYKVWCAIILGAISGCLLIAFAFSTFKAIFYQNTLAGVIIIVAFILTVLIYYLVVRKKKKRDINGA